jgi:hypothetical protein
MDPRANFPYDALGFGGSNLRSHQPDEAQFETLRKRMINGMLPFNCVIELLQAKNSPPQVRQNVYSVDLIHVNEPQLLIPTNQKRMGFVVTNVSTKQIFFSYDFPKEVMVSGTATLVGIPIGSLNYFLESNGLASVNDIYVWCSDSTGGDYPIAVGGWEAVVTISPENVVSKGPAPSAGY